MTTGKIGFFTDANGNPSMTRVLSAMTCLVGWVIPIISAVKGTMNAHTVAIALGFVTAALGIKALGAKIEGKK